MVANSRVFIAYRQALLARAIEGTLNAEDGIEVVACERVDDALRQRLQALNPAVVILDRHELAGAIDYIAPDICRDNPGMRVIVIEHGANVVDVFRFDHEQVIVRDPLDIVGIVRGNPG